MKQSQRTRWWRKALTLVLAIPFAVAVILIACMMIYILTGAIFSPGVLIITVENKGRTILKGGSVHSEHDIVVHRLGPVAPHTIRTFTFRDVEGSYGDIVFTFADSSRVEATFAPPDDRDTARVEITATDDSITGEVPRIAARELAQWWYRPGGPAGHCDTCAVKLPGAAVRKRM